MPTRSSAPLGAPCWIDLTTSDVDRAQDFYGTVFGWAFESAGPDYGGYINAAKGGHPVAGLMANRPSFSLPTAGPPTFIPSTSVRPWPSWLPRAVRRAWTRWKYPARAS